MTGPAFVDRKGHALTTAQWAELWQDMTYRTVAEDTIGDTIIRTVWEGITAVGYLYYTGISEDGGHKWRTACHTGTEGGALAAHRRIAATHRLSIKE